MEKKKYSAARGWAEAEVEARALWEAQPEQFRMPLPISFSLTCPGQRAGREDFVGGERLDVVSADAGDADGLAKGVEEFEDSALRLAGRAGDDVNKRGDIASAKIVLRKIAEKFYLFIQL